MRRVQAGPLAGFAGVLALLGVLAAAVGLGALGWLVGLTCGAAANAALARGLARHHVTGLGPANVMTLTRCVLGCGVAALVADSFIAPAPVTMLVTLSTVALVLDAVDGQVARRTRTTSSLGARFDLEVDAFLILVLSVYVARTTGWWVLAIGAARYVFVAARPVFAWLRGSAPPRYWCKVVAALQGVVLTVAVADVLPPHVSVPVLAVALLMLAESFCREALELWRAGPGAEQAPLEPSVAGGTRDD